MDIAVDEFGTPDLGELSRVNRRDYRIVFNAVDAPFFIFAVELHRSHGRVRFNRTAAFFKFCRKTHDKRVIAFLKVSQPLSARLSVRAYCHPRYEPCGGDLLSGIPEFAPQKRLEEGFVHAFAALFDCELHSPRVLVFCRIILLCAKHEHAEPEFIYEGEVRISEYVNGCGKRVDFAVYVIARAAREPFEAVVDSEFL